MKALRFIFYNLDTKGAAEKLSGLQQGSFILRNSTSQPGSIVFSTIYTNGEFKEYLIEQREYLQKEGSKDDYVLRLLNDNANILKVSVFPLIEGTTVTTLKEINDLLEDFLHKITSFLNSIIGISYKWKYFSEPSNSTKDEICLAETLSKEELDNLFKSLSTCMNLHLASSEEVSFRLPRSILEKSYYDLYLFAAKEQVKRNIILNPDTLQTDLSPWQTESIKLFENLCVVYKEENKLFPLLESLKKGDSVFYNDQELNYILANHLLDHITENQDTLSAEDRRYWYQQLLNYALKAEEKGQKIADTAFCSLVSQHTGLILPYQNIRPNLSTLTSLAGSLEEKSRSIKEKQEQIELQNLLIQTQKSLIEQLQNELKAQKKDESSIEKKRKREVSPSVRLFASKQTEDEDKENQIALERQKLQ